MRYRVVTETTPLWADHQRSRKLGKILFGTVFETSEDTIDGGLAMGHVIGQLMCVGGHTDGGWVELKNCINYVPGTAPVVTGKTKKYLITVEEL